MLVKIINGGPCATNVQSSDFEWTPGKLVVARIGTNTLDVHFVEIDYWRRVVTARTAHSESDHRRSIDMVFEFNADASQISGVLKSSIREDAFSFQLASA